MADIGQEFLLHVMPSGGLFVATCQPYIDVSRGDIEVSRPLGDASNGIGATALAACVAALMNSQVQEITETQVSQ